jgi:hypothetical protein
MLLRDGLSPGWCILYFLNPGALYYSQTLMAAVPAALMGLLGVSLRMRPAPPRMTLGGLALGCAVLLHPWMGPLVAFFSAVWLLENGGAGIIERALKLASGAAPAVALLATYNYFTTGFPLRYAYWVLGHQHDFKGAHIASLAPFYLFSLMIFPLGGWALLFPRWAKGSALPAATAATLMLGSLYYYRDGLNLQSQGIVHFLTGAIPGQRFLLPVSLLACLPAARWLDSILSKGAAAMAPFPAGLACVAFVAGFWVVSAAHESYLRARAALQRALDRDIPAGGEVAVVSAFGINFDACKEFAPVYKIRWCFEVDPADGAAKVPEEAYVMCAGPREATAPHQWFARRDSLLISVRSWIWNSDIWLGAHRTASADS